MKDWSVYIVRCSDGTLYTGSTNDIERRLKMHNEGKGARYTSGRGPVQLGYRENGWTKSQAFAREAAIKSLTRLDKIKLCNM